MDKQALLEQVYEESFDDEIAKIAADSGSLLSSVKEHLTTRATRNVDRIRASNKKFEKPVAQRIKEKSQRIKRPLGFSAL